MDAWPNRGSQHHADDNGGLEDKVDNSADNPEGATPPTDDGISDEYIARMQGPVITYRLKGDEQKHFLAASTGRYDENNYPDEQTVPGFDYNAYEMTPDGSKLKELIK